MSAMVAFLLMGNQFQQSTYVLKVAEEFDGAPPQFKKSFQFLVDGDLSQAAQEFAGLVVAGGMDSAWTTNAVACAAFARPSSETLRTQSTSPVWPTTRNFNSHCLEAITTTRR